MWAPWRMEYVRAPKKDSGNIFSKKLESGKNSIVNILYPINNTLSDVPLVLTRNQFAKNQLFMINGRNMIYCKKVVISTNLMRGYCAATTVCCKSHNLNAKKIKCFS